MERPTLVRVGLLMLLGLAARLVVFWLVPTPPIAGDAPDYLAMATLQAGWRPPGYPLFIALPNAIGGPAFVIFTQVALSIGTGVTTYLLLRPKRHAFLAAALIVSSPFIALYDQALLSEALYVPLVWLAWLTLDRKPLVAATLLGFAVLSRETLLLLPLCAMPFVARRWWPAFAAAALAGVPVAVQAPYGALNLWIGTWERNTDWYRNGLANADFPKEAFRSVEERRAVMSEWPKVPTRVAVERIADEPFKTAGVWLRRFPNLWIGDRSELFSYPHSYWWRLLMRQLNLLLLAAGLIGLLRAPKFAVPLLYAAAVYFPFHAEIRYTLFAVPFLSYGAALAWFRLLDFKEYLRLPQHEIDGRIAALHHKKQLLEPRRERS